MTRAAGGTLTQRVVWALTGTVALFVTALALLAYLTFDQMEDDLVNDILNTEMDRLVQHARASDEFMPRQGVRELGGSMRAWMSVDGQRPAGIPDEVLALDSGLHLIEPGAYTWHVMVAETGRGKVYLLYDATDNEERVHDFGLIVLGVGAICVVGAYSLSRRVAAVAVGPLLDLTDRLATWAPGSPDMAVTRDDEAGRLIEAFNRVQNQVDRSIAREREFAGNLSHEVRTPLAAIRSDSELMLLTQALTPDQRQRLTRIVDNVDDVIVCLESARAMARDQLRPPEPVDIAECMEDAWRGYEAQAGLAELRFDNQIAQGHVLTLDRYALLTVMRNLVRNAVEHAAPATLTASFSAQGVLELGDNGKGINADDLPFLFRRYYSGRMRDSTAGSRDETARGLGLAIAKRVCDMQGWSLTVESSREAEPRGTRFSLDFGSAIATADTPPRSKPTGGQGQI
ncbi:HAMP domain-containing sensor histidine kinase [Achromobacter seleniivolatilans]|uniref:histidine kinase n=1 Tax=Achromobacter seleniivolatilans TaxID=3047478 RepID=A0ABY9M1P2_9BURK|nr:HAMP domain-containing sensor histidine kinase [Achromobacter sp. R39]WMD20113.1 HAMP domain-containing sensor histidine kinase [Achromobacter sp. R39]